MRSKIINSHPQNWKTAEYFPFPLTSHPRTFICKYTKITTAILTSVMFDSLNTSLPPSKHTNLIFIMLLFKQNSNKKSDSTVQREDCCSKAI